MAISPKLQAAIEELARVTVRTGGDPVKVLLAIQAAATYRDKVWPHLTPQQRYAVLVKLRRARERNRRLRLPR
jgi:acyl-CoA reductase-like NAD-dependent aldehyde dehydrogenase